jgi:hypothetical protein
MGAGKIFAIALRPFQACILFFYLFMSYLGWHFMKIVASATIGIVHKNCEILLNSYKAFVMTSSWLYPIDLLMSSAYVVAGLIDGVQD